MSTIKKIELKVNINSEKCKTQLMTAVAKLEGIDELTVNAEKGTMIVIGTVDPVCVVAKLRKAKKFVQIISIGPPKKPEEPKKPDAKKPDEKPKVCEPLPLCCKQCQLVAVSYTTYDPVCSIL